MSQIIADDNLKAQLQGLKEAVEVREPSGRLLGQFVPQEEYKRRLYAWANSLFTDEEIAEAEQNVGPFLSLDQLLKEREPR